MTSIDGGIARSVAPSDASHESRMFMRYGLWLLMGARVGVG